MVSRIEKLRQDFTKGNCTLHGSEPNRNRYFVFADGSIWFPEGAQVIAPAQAALPLLFGLFIISGVVTVVCWADGVAWRWPLTGVTLAVLAALILVGKREVQRSEEAERNLECGLFLIGEQLILRDGEIFQTFDRQAVASLKIRRAYRDGEKPRSWVHLILKGEILQDVPTDLTEPAAAVLEKWLKNSRQEHADELTPELLTPA